MKVDKTIRNIIVAEIVFPIVLLVFGIYHGLMQVLYRAGVIKDMSVGGIEYYQGLTLHGVINAIVFTTILIVAFGNIVFLYYLKKAFKALGSMDQPCAYVWWHPYGCMGYVHQKGKRAIHLLPSSYGPLDLLPWCCAFGSWFYNPPLL